MRASVTALVAALALGLAGCGGSDDDDGGGGSSKGEFITQADAICERVNARIGGVNAELQSVTGSATEKLAKIEPILRRAIHVQDRAIEDFRALEPPDEDRDLIGRYLGAAEKQSEVLGTMADAARSGDAKRYAVAARELPEVSERRRALVADYGFEQCGGSA